MAEVYFKVTTEHFFVIPPDVVGNDEELGRIIEDWFSENRLNNLHAVRDGRRIGGADRCLSVEHMTQGEFDEYIHTRGRIDLGQP